MSVLLPIAHRLLHLLSSQLLAVVFIPLAVVGLPAVAAQRTRLVPTQGRARQTERREREFIAFVLATPVGAEVHRLSR